MFKGQIETSDRINLMYEDTTLHYQVIGSLTGTIAKQFVCKACDKGCSSDATHTCDRTCSDCMVSPSCVHAGVRIPCADCNWHFRSQTCFTNHKLKQETKRVFVTVNASANHVMYSLNLPENMNVAHTTAKSVKPTKRDSISAICNH
jgi:hypothetical protein